MYLLKIQKFPWSSSSSSSLLLLLASALAFALQYKYYLILSKFREYFISRKVKRHISQVLNFAFFRRN